LAKKVKATLDGDQNAKFLHHTGGAPRQRQLWLSQRRPRKVVSTFRLYGRINSGASLRHLFTWLFTWCGHTSLVEALVQP